jgi:hypothetical protein
MPQGSLPGGWLDLPGGIRTRWTANRILEAIASLPPFGPGFPGRTVSDPDLAKELLSQWDKSGTPTGPPRRGWRRNWITQASGVRGRVGEIGIISEFRSIHSRDPTPREEVPPLCGDRVRHRPGRDTLPRVSRPAKAQPATIADLLAILEEHRRHEVIDGTLVEKEAASCSATTTRNDPRFSVDGETCESRVLAGKPAATPKRRGSWSPAMLVPRIAQSRHPRRRVREPLPEPVKNAPAYAHSLRRGKRGTSIAAAPRSFQTPKITTK